MVKKGVFVDNKVRTDAESEEGMGDERVEVAVRRRVGNMIEVFLKLAGPRKRCG